jgi:hypothetical protein
LYLLLMPDFGCRLMVRIGHHLERLAARVPLQTLDHQALFGYQRVNDPTNKKQPR